MGGGGGMDPLDYINWCSESIWINVIRLFDYRNTPNKLRIEENILIEENVIKAICKKPTANIMLNGERLKTFLLKSGMRQTFLFYHYYSTEFGNSNKNN